MPKFTAKSLTAAVVEKAKPGEKAFELRDALQPGMTLIVYPSGVKAWALRYWLDGKFYKITLGRYSPDADSKIGLTLAAARELAREKRAMVNAGDNPATKNKQTRKTDFIENVWDDYLARHLEVNAKPSSVARFK
jgi:hypothetical protein